MLIKTYGTGKPALLFLALVLFILIGVYGAWADTGYRALDEAAITVKSPANVTLVAVTLSDQRLVAAGEHGVIIYSDDNGVSWHQADVPVNVTITDLAFPSPADGWAVGHYGVILHSTDHGQSWSLMQDGIDISKLMLSQAQSGKAPSFAFADMPTQLKIANAFVSDGPNKPLMKIQQCDNNRILALGAYNLAVATSDDGKTWQDLSQNIADPTIRNLYDSATVDGNVYIVGEGGIVLRSDMDCNQFVALNSPTQATLFGVLSAGNDGLLVFGLGGGAFRSLDQGKTWQTIDLATQAILSAGQQLRNGGIVLVAMDGHIYFSKDAAKSFHVLPVQEHQQLAAVAQAPNGDLVVVGNVGVNIIHASDLR